MHTARYTFATTITLANNVKLENVSKMLGHTNTRMTLHYAHIMNESLAQEMNKVAAIMGEWQGYKKNQLVSRTNQLILSSNNKFINYLFVNIG